MKKLFVVESNIEGKGIYTSEAITKGEHIAFIKGATKTKLSTSVSDALSIPLWYGLTETTWIDPENTIWRYFNHSCKPNTAIVGTRKLIALSTIKPNTEITFDYSMTDGDMLWEMACKCGQSICRKNIQSIQRLPEAVFKKHLPFIPKYFVQLRKQYLKSARMG